MRPAGLEPAILGLEGRCIIRLCYGREDNKGVLPECKYEIRKGEKHIYKNTNRGERIRTSDLRYPKPARYQTALRPEGCAARRRASRHPCQRWGGRGVTRARHQRRSTAGAGAVCNGRPRRKQACCDLFLGTLSIHIKTRSPRFTYPPWTARISSTRSPGLSLVWDH